MDDKKIDGNSQPRKAKESSKDTFKTNRRTVFKALSSLPFVALFGYEFGKMSDYKSEERRNRSKILKELGVNEKNPVSIIPASNKKSDHIRIGVIGCGDRALRIMRAAGFLWQEKLEDLRSEKNSTALNEWLNQDDLNISITGICDVFDIRAEAAVAQSKNSIAAIRDSKSITGAKRFRHHRELLESKDIDAVIIATPDHHHAQMIIDAIQAGKHVYCEKSLTRTEDEVYKVYNAVKNSDRVFQLGHQIRQNPIYTQARDLVRNGALGHVNLVECTSNRNSSEGAWIRHRINGKPKPGSPQSIDWDQWLGTSDKVPFSIDRYYNWTKYWDYANGLGGQLFSHEFDAVNGILECGIPKSCMASGGIYHYNDGREIPDVFQAVYEFSDKKMSLLYSATLMSSRQRGRVFMGSDASMEIGGDLKIIADADSEKYQSELESGLISSNDPILSLSPNSGVDAISSATSQYYESRGLTNVVIDGKKVDVTHLHIKEWLNAIRYGTPVSCGIDVSFDEAITVIMSTKSYREKRMVEWDAKERKII
jgi:predicted dehydrogenase